MEPIFKTTPYDTAGLAAAAAGTKSPADSSNVNGHRENVPVTPETDRYTPEEKDASIGLYRIDSDENGKRRISFESPKTVANNKAAPDNPSAPAEKSPNPDAPKRKDEDNKAESCTANTDKVDREIKQLRQKENELEARLRTEKDASRAEALEQELAKVERELNLKDNDRYRRQHTVFS